MNRYLSTLAIAIAAALTMTAHPAQAEKVVIYREGQLVQPQDVAAVLGGTRSIRLLDEEPAPAPAKDVTRVATSSADEAAPASSPIRKVSASASQRTVRHGTVADASALSLPVRFAFDSSEIQPAARAQLDALAAGIKMLPPERIVTVEGHTDAFGTEAYNLELSRSRARAVRDYLVQHHGIQAARLKTVGYGEQRPVEESDPHAAINRRVQFRGS